MWTLFLSLILIFSFVLQPGLTCAQTYSDLWGKNGDSWTPYSRLPDFSYAGYAQGERPIPKVQQVTNIKLFGAVGDGETDDSKAFLKALSTVKRGAIYIPPGRYKITRIIEVNRSNVVLRGAGPSKTILYFPLPLNKIEPDWGTTTSGKRTSEYSWSGGFVWFNGWIEQKKLARVIDESSRGSRVLKVSSTKRLKTGQWIQISLKDDRKKSLFNHLYSDDPGNTDAIKPASHKIRLVCRITSIMQDGIVLDRPLRCDVKLEWKPRIRSFKPSVSECGIENLCFEFPKRKYDGHFSELGFNAIAFDHVYNCWARNIKIVNADSGIFAKGRFCTVQGVTFELQGAETTKNNLFGHHGIFLQGDDNLFTAFNFKTRFIHDISVSRCSGNVISNGKGVDLCFDHHKRAPFANLFTNIDIGKGSRMWRSGGGANLGRHCGAHETFWNIRAERSQNYPGSFYGPDSMNLIAVKTDSSSEKALDKMWFEDISPDGIQPQSLHEAQLSKRLSTFPQHNMPFVCEGHPLQ